MTSPPPRSQVSPEEQPDITLRHSKLCHGCREDEEWEEVAERWEAAAYEPEDGEVAERICDECGEQLYWWWFVRLEIIPEAVGEELKRRFVKVENCEVCDNTGTVAVPGDSPRPCTVCGRSMSLADVIGRLAHGG